MYEPLSDLSASKQNSRVKSSPLKIDKQNQQEREHREFVYDNSPPDSATFTTAMADVAVPQTTAFGSEEFYDASPYTNLDFRPSSRDSASQSPRKGLSPVRYRLQDNAQATHTPPDSPIDQTVRFNEGLTRTIGDMQEAARTESAPSEEARHTSNACPQNEQQHSEGESRTDFGDDTDFTLSFDEKIGNDDTIGNLSTISAIPTDLTQFANLGGSPTKKVATESWSPSKQLRNSVIFGTPGTTTRPLHLLSASRHSNSSNEDDEATPRRPAASGDSPTDLMNFTGQSNILIPPPGSAPRSARRSPSGRGAFPVKVNTDSQHRSQASVDREKASGRSPPKQDSSRFADRSAAATPANKRHSMFVGPNTAGLDLLDIDFEPMATPRSIPTITPRELETLRSELQSRISGLEATLSGKEAEVMALKRAITDAEVRVGKISEELHTERAAREDIEQQKDELERRSREMEDVLREVKQNAFVEEREREKLRRQAEEAERRAEEHEVKILELNAALETLRSERVKNTPSPHNPMDPTTPGMSTNVDFAVKDATEKVARELHALYKGKHERKVADLKVSYEKRWIKQVDQLRAELKTSQDEVLKMQTEKEATMSGVIPGQSEAISKMDGQIEELRRFNEEVTAEKKVLEASVAGLKGEVESIIAKSQEMRKDLEQERVEKGELVAQVDLFLALAERQEHEKAVQPISHPVSPPRSEDGRPNSAAAISSPNKLRTSMNGGTPGVAGTTGGRPRPMSMLQKPTGGKFSGIPAPGSGLKGPSGNTGRGLSYAGRSGGIMEGIARMGAGSR